MLTFLRVAAARIRGFVRPGELDRDFDDELESHLAMAEEEKVRQGMNREQARRMARVELGGLTQLRLAGHQARGLPWLDSYWLDSKLGLRMLRKSWGLTLVGGLAMTLAIGVAVAVFAVLDFAFLGQLPLDDGQRVIALQTWDAKAHGRVHTAMADYECWRDSMRTLDDMGAFQTVERQLTIGGAPQQETGEGYAAAKPVPIAEITASGFELARVAPLLGRPILAEDEAPDADPVVVIGYDAWQTRFFADPNVVGKTVSIGDTVHTVVGVMPEGFAFPVNHRFWTALRLDRNLDLRDGGPSGVIFARLAKGVSLERAQSELATLGLLPTTTADDATSELRPRIVPYAFAFTGDFEPSQVRWVIRVVLFIVTLLLIPPCANIAILVYARTVTRQEEFAARFVLGASRARIVGQLFIEMLLLAAGSAAVALLVAQGILARIEGSISKHMTDGAPFWYDFTLSFRTVLFAALLAVLAATVAGVIPALKATGSQMKAGLQALSARTGLRLGRTWTALVATQIGLSLAALPSAIEMGWGTVRQDILGPGFAAEEYLTARLEIDPQQLAVEGKVSEQSAVAARVATIQADLVRRVEAEPGVAQTTLALTVPGDEPWTSIEAEGIVTEETMFAGSSLVRYNRVDDAFMSVFEIPILAGRGFEAGDFEPARRAVLINQTFAQQVFGESNPLGRRVRYRSQSALASDPTPAASEEGNWYEIVGVVGDRPALATNGTMYQPVARGRIGTLSLAVRVSYPPAGLADRLQDIAINLHPSVSIAEIFALDEVYRQQATGNNIGASVLVLVTLSVLLLSAAGIYALMSFTVNRRRREIGIRSALGAQPSRLLAGIFRQALGQLAIGAGIGMLIALVIDYYVPIENVGGWTVPGVIPVAAIVMVLVGLLAAFGPARRGLEVDPSEALQEG